MKMIVLATATLSVLAATPVRATPGLGGEVYAATIEPETEIEARYGRLAGRSEDGAEALIVEASHGFSTKFRAALLAEFEREPGGGRRASAFAFEAIHTLGRVGGIDAALYGEYEVARHGPNKVETKLLLQKRAGPIDTRLNLVAERQLIAGAPVTFGYAVSVDVATVGNFRLGAAAFGDLNGDEGGHHFAGPIIKADIEHVGPGDFELETGYLFALGTARDDARGQFRLLAGYAFPF